MTWRLAELLEPEEFAALIAAGYITAEYEPMREALHLTPEEVRWLEKVIRRAPKGRLYGSRTADPD